MRNCAWMILRGASEASRESVTVGPFAPKTENDDSRKIARQENLLTPQLEPIPPPDYRFVRSDANRIARKYISTRVRFAPGRRWELLPPAVINRQPSLLSSPTCPRAENLSLSKALTAAAR